jgi:ArsR family transcriptional regulator
MEKSSIIAALAALAQESRLDIFRLLVQAGGQGRAVGFIGERLGYPSATLSFHLNQLKQAGLVTVRREGRSLIYAANLAAMGTLVRYLTENCCGGSAADCGIGVQEPCSPAICSEGNTDELPAHAFFK